MNYTEINHMYPAISSIHHATLNLTAEQVSGLVDWYISHTACQVVYRDGAHAVLRLNNVFLTLAVPGQRRPRMQPEWADVADHSDLTAAYDLSRGVYLTCPGGLVFDLRLILHDSEATDPGRKSTDDNASGD